MASVRRRPRKDGDTWATLYTLNGKQTSVPWNTEGEAHAFKDLVNRVGAERAMEIEGITPPTSHPDQQVAITLTEWCNHYIDHQTGLEQGTIDLYRLFVRVDIDPYIGAIPLTKLTEEDVSRWVRTLATTKGKRTDQLPAVNSLKNKHAFLAGALKKAVPRLIPNNPAATQRVPKTIAGRGTPDVTTLMLSRDEFDRLLDAMTEPWRPLLCFLVASGCRWGEATALTPRDVNRNAGTVRITKSWKHSPSAGYVLGAPKTVRSKRTVNVPKWALNQLDYGREWLFTNPRNGGPVRYHTFRSKHWLPAVERSGLQPPPRIHHLRHTYASWMLNAGVPITVVSRQLGHTSINTTVDIYGDLDRGIAAQAADVMGEILARPSLKEIESD